MPACVGIDSEATQELLRHRILQTSEWSCGFVAVQVLTSFFSNGRCTPSVRSLHLKLNELGFPQLRTGTDSIHLTWLLWSAGYDAMTVVSDRHLQEVWKKPVVDYRRAGVRLRGRLRQGKWAASVLRAGSILAAERRLFFGEPKLTPLIELHQMLALVLRVESSEYFSDRADKSAHFVSFLPSVYGFAIMDGYGKSNCRAAAYDWLGWSNDLVVVQNPCSAPQHRHDLRSLAVDLKAYPVLAIEAGT